ncbi:FAD binding domain-containing protein [Mycena sanguinolenta]|uniref:FAD binding domain-containing protein n=1 Tax=Mycena sanguinolenta TaxID=230812 RepID=A0A8H7DLW3_9AGAR|nr:FAD binding domain-containing protein [Mycena sanguinolenta]
MHPSLIAAAVHALLLAWAATLPQAASASTTTKAPGACKCFPGDACWPSDAEWSAFNETVGGRLIKTVPLGFPCYAPHHNATECAILQSDWLSSPVHYNSSSSVQVPIFADASCDPFTTETRPADSETIPLVNGQSQQEAVNNQDQLTTEFISELKQLTPGSGSYNNEVRILLLTSQKWLNVNPKADFQDPDFKLAFWGANYNKLLAIHDKWDPDQLLYGSINVGGDRWKETGKEDFVKSDLILHLIWCIKRQIKYQKQL